jgi:CRISPR-associated protein Csx10
MYLQIKLLSDTAPGSGSDEVGGIDRSVVFDEKGLPYIPARRLKGVLREAVLETLEAQTVANRNGPISLALIAQLFGKGGQQSPGLLVLSSAQLADADNLTQWLEWAATQDAALVSPEAVRNSYSGLRAQTSLSRVTGGPVENTLRITRVLQRGLKFRAEVELKPDPAPDDLNNLKETLALACAAARRLGLSRNRGLGEVQIKLFDDDNTQVEANILKKNRPGGQP